MNKQGTTKEITLATRIHLALAVTIAALALLPAAAHAEFGFSHVDATMTDAAGAPSMQAGSHPFKASFSVAPNLETVPGLGTVPSGQPRDLRVQLPPGVLGNPEATPKCSAAEFATLTSEYQGVEYSGLYFPACPEASIVGYADVTGATQNSPPIEVAGAIFNMVPAPGEVARFAFHLTLVGDVFIDVNVKRSQPYNAIATTRNIVQLERFYSARLDLWSHPSDPGHDDDRSVCGMRFFGFDFGDLLGIKCGAPSDPGIAAFTLPGSCSGPLNFSYETDSWQNPGVWVSSVAETHDNAEPPNPLGTSGCGKLTYAPAVESKVTTDQAESGSGLDFNLDFHDEGLLDPEGLAQSYTKKAEVVLPEGLTINPSVGEGLGVCTPADLERETLEAAAGEGCPNTSKIGSLASESPLLDRPITGSVYLAEQDDPTTSEPGAENPFDSLIALYFVVKDPELGVLIKLPVKIEPDPSTGKLVATLDEVPQLPISHFNAHLRTGARAALVTPATCGTYTTRAVLTPWADQAHPHTATASFDITKGKAGGPCPAGGIPPFSPKFEAGSLNNNAASHTEFDMRLLREDGEQDMTKFSAVLPPGVVGSLVGIEKCPDSAVAAAKAKTGRQELASPSCPANSEIGHTLAGAGVGSALTYVPGKIYLGGAYHGDPLSVIAITPAVAGPFDAGTVAVRLALTLNPKTAEVEVDGANSDPIPHILKGIVLKMRDLRVYVDRPNFILNPTSCDESSARSTLFGSYLNVLDPADDVPVDLSTRYQAANCLNLGFKPKLGLRLKGGTKRGAHPGLRAVYSPRAGDANLEDLITRLPRSAFLDQAHIRTICTRVQFAADNCPKAAQYGYIRAWTPLLEEPLQGPAYLRSSNHKLPDLVFDLHGLVDVEVSTRLDSFKGGIRATVEDAPDAPLARVVLTMQGGKKGLIVNSRNLCARKSKANVQFNGHNGKQSTTKPVVRAQCKKRRRHKRHH